MKQIFVIACLLMGLMGELEAQNYLDKSWKQVASQMDESWYGSAEAAEVAQKVMRCQRSIGGWAKNKDYHKLDAGEIAAFEEAKDEIGATIDNGATSREMLFLAHVYRNQPDESYRQAFIKGLNYLFEAQYENGGWPQFYPARTGKSVQYASHITYNDNAMINVMRLLEDIFKDHSEFRALKLSDELKAQAKESFDQGVQCILKTQIRVNGQPTVWCAQHDELSLEPANARKYELASFSGAESVNITDLLMDLENPSPEVIAAVEGAVQWFRDHKLLGIRIEKQTNEAGQQDRVVVSDPDADPIWARFYDLETGKPYFCDRDGIKKWQLSDIGYERRNGYGWYTYKPEKILEAYPDWKNDWVE